MIQLVRFADALPADFAGLRAEAEAGGHSMLGTLAAEWVSGANRFDQPGEMLLAAFAGDELTGIGGLTREPAIAGALRVRRFYVRTVWRRHGVGRALADRLLAAARRNLVTVTCNAAAGSEAFWEALGFTPDRRERHTHILR